MNRKKAFSSFVVMSMLFSFVGCGQQIAVSDDIQNTNTAFEQTTTLEDVIKIKEELTFPIGNEINSHSFVGTAYIAQMIPNDKIYHFPQTNNITFAPGARSSWHSHGGMVILVTGGVGYYQEGKVAQIIRKGDVVECPEGAKHWHGGSANTSFAHIAVNTNTELTGLEWFDRISEQEYQQLPTE